MCDQPLRKSEAEQDNLRQLPRWARRYAQSRSLGLLVSMAIFAAGSAAFGGLGVLMAAAFRSGNVAAEAACGVLLVAVGGFWVWMCIAGMERVVGAATRRLYREEGEVTLHPERKPGRPLRRAFGVVVGMAAATAVAVVLGMLLTKSNVPLRYMQPISALLVVPFLVALWAGNRQALSPIGLLWAGLYALHAVLIVAGAPVVFTGRLEILNMGLPVLGYGVLTAVVGHLYNRYALARMRQVAASREPEGGGEPA